MPSRFSKKEDGSPLPAALRSDTSASSTSHQFVRIACASTFSFRQARRIFESSRFSIRRPETSHRSSCRGGLHTLDLDTFFQERFDKFVGRILVGDQHLNV